MASTVRTTATTASPAASGVRRRGGALGRLTAIARRLSGPLAFAILALASAPAALGQGAPSAADLKHGEELLAANCGRCHAVGRTGDSARPDAPAFRVLGQRYPIDSLEESLGEGIMSGHPDMPEISFEADDVGNIVDYLKSIQTPR